MGGADRLGGRLGEVADILNEVGRIGKISNRYVIRVRTWIGGKVRESERGKERERESERGKVREGK